MSEASPNILAKKRMFWILLIASIFMLAAYILFQLSFSYFKNVEYERAQNRVSLYRSTLVGELERFQHLPFILSKDPFVIAGAKGVEREKLSARFASFATKANLDAIYLMDKTGLTIAASNYKNKVTFLNQNYGFRPYFKRAMEGKRGEFFGIGATTSLPGYFIAQMVRGEYGETLGVIAIKLDLSDLSNAWNEGGEMVFVSNSDGVVVLSSNEEWRYKSLAPINENRRKEIALERQFANEKLAPLNWESLKNNGVRLSGRDYVHANTSVSRLGWNLHFLADESRIKERAWFTIIVATILAFASLTLALILRSERMKNALKVSQAERRKLRLANTKLAQEVIERRAAEKRLEKAQVELARNSKLAALGQLSASVTHELGQPISAMKNYIAAAEFDKDEKDRAESLGNLSGIIARMVNITKQLRFFAKPAEIGMKKIDLRDVWQGVNILVDADIKEAGIKLKLDIAEKPIFIFANQLRLEQVLINLIRNSIAALEGCKKCEIKISIGADKKYAHIIVKDSGHGLGDQSIEQLKEPFHTTRASGSGMGLGLAISAEIIKEHGGELMAENSKISGAIFIIKIPLWSKV
jgi:two-component system C4-dicarboxylate transport sensor histidine kinase DctB